MGRTQPTEYRRILLSPKILVKFIMKAHFVMEFVEGFVAGTNTILFSDNTDTVTRNCLFNVNYYNPKIFLKIRLGD